MTKIRFYNLKKIFKFINRLKTEPIGFPSVFSSIKKMTMFFILYLFVTGITALIVIFSINKNQEMETVPKVINMKFYKAYEVLNSRGFNVDLELKTFNNFNKGIVAYQSIEEQKKVKKGRKIKLVVSLGAKKEEEYSGGLEYVINSYIIKFKLPENFDTARVKILLSDEKEKDILLFDRIISPTNKILLPVKIHGQGIQKIYIDEELFIEKDIE